MGQACIIRVFCLALEPIYILGVYTTPVSSDYGTTLLTALVRSGRNFSWTWKPIAVSILTSWLTSGFFIIYSSLLSTRTRRSGHTPGIIIPCRSAVSAIAAQEICFSSACMTTALAGSSTIQSLRTSKSTTFKRMASTGKTLKTLHSWTIYSLIILKTGTKRTHLT